MINKFRKCFKLALPKEPLKRALSETEKNEGKKLVRLLIWDQRSYFRSPGLRTQQGNARGAWVSRIANSGEKTSQGTVIKIYKFNLQTWNILNHLNLTCYPPTYYKLRFGALSLRPPMFRRRDSPRRIPFLLRSHRKTIRSLP